MTSVEMLTACSAVGSTGPAAEIVRRLAALERQLAVLVDRVDGESTAVDPALRGLVVTRVQAQRLTRDGTDDVVDMQYVPLPLVGRLASIAERTGLDAIDIDILIAALAPDIDPRFERLYGYVHDDLTRRRLSIGLALRLCSRSVTAPQDRARFAAHAGLRRHALIDLDESERPFPGRSLRVPDHVVDVLLGADGVEPIFDRLIVETVGLADDYVQPLVDVVEHETGAVYLLEGIGGAGVHAAAQTLRRIHPHPLVVDLESVASDEVGRTVAALVRHHALTGAPLVLRSADQLFAGNEGAIDRLQSTCGRLVLVGSRPWEAHWSSRVPRMFEMPELTGKDLAAIWHRSMRGANSAPGALEAVVSSFRLTPEQVVRAARTASDTGSSMHAEIGFAELSAAARIQSASGLDRLARRIEPVVTWDDLILPHEVMILLRELPVRVRWREQVMQQWELGRGWRGRGIAALFAGPSGTGKTTAAEVIAKDLGYDIHVVDLSTVVDKYIGETEKKLEVIFTEAERTNTVLLFDEADAIFGKRSEVKDARDRYANIEVSYLLQRIERFAGLAILTTNLGANLDEAFTRRLDVVVDFPRPDAAAREKLWRHEFRPAVPTGGLDLEFCATAFDLTGGNIRNIVVTAAYLAAESQRAVSMTDVVAAVQREYRKMGRLCLVSEFGPYSALLR